MGALLLVTWLVVAGRSLLAQCPDGSPPPCRVAPRGATPTAPALDPNLIAILPFRVTGADPSLAYLGDGMVDLLAAVLTGEAGLRAVDPGAALSAARRGGIAAGAAVSTDVARRVARGLRAGQLVSGATIGGARRLTLTASLMDVASGRLDVPVVRVDGPTDSLLALVEELGARLLARRAGERAERARKLGTTSLAAVQAYLSGRAAYRRADWEEAARHFERAVQVDSGFALAGLGLARAAGWIGDGSRVDRGTRIAWEGREKLDAVDRAIVTAFAGPRYPAPPWGDEHLRAWRHAVTLAPDHAEAWYNLGDRYFHWGTVLGVAGWQRLAADGFRRALELDSLTGSGVEAGSLRHLLELAALAGDAADLRRLGTVAIRGTRDSTYYRWLLAHVMRDSAQLARVRPVLLREPTSRLYNLTAAIVHFGIGLEDVDLFLAALRERMAPDDLSELLYLIALNRGRPAEGARALTSGRRIQAILDALYWDGDSAAARGAAEELAAAIAGEIPEDVDAREVYLRRSCVVEQWRLAHGDTMTATGAIARLHSTAEPADSALTVIESAVCARMLEAMVAAAHGAPDAAAVLVALDSLMLRVPPVAVLVFHLQYVNLVVARLHEARGDLPSALAAVRRRTPFQFLPLYFSTYLREEGRLAALAGDTAGAIRAYWRYLDLRREAEPALIPQRDSVRTALARLERK
ncbi:MAG: hypothetical protein HYS40_05725 [Gemmatimonadetes bacterium]|nr:hypothetical protein [Gemmatimonadota bacterium]